MQALGFFDLAPTPSKGQNESTSDLLPSSYSPTGVDFRAKPAEFLPPVHTQVRPYGATPPQPFNRSLPILKREIITLAELDLEGRDGHGTTIGIDRAGKLVARFAGTSGIVHFADRR